MAKHSRRGSVGSRVIDQLLIGLMLAGVAFVGIAIASQRAPSALASIGDPVPQPSARSARSNPMRPPAEDPSGPVSAVVGPGSTMASVTDATSSDPPRVLRHSPPVRLDIDRIGVHSDLHDLGLDDAGAIEAPSGARYDQAAWYRYSPAPGSLGPSIILGHVDSAANGPSVFFRLAELVAGDRISVTRADGSTARFTVDEVRRYPKEDFPTQRVYGDLDHAGLRLITCGGAFNESSGHYEDNIIVFARLSGASP